MKHILLAAAALALAPIAQAGEIHISFSEELNEKIADDYGERERERLVDELTEDLMREFAPILSSVGDVNVVIEDARPNRPTFEQMTEQSLSFESISIGGAEMTGEVFSLSGELIASEEYDYFSHDITDSVGRATWSDARRAFSRFATRFADTAEEAMSASSTDEVGR